MECRRSPESRKGAFASHQHSSQKYDYPRGKRQTRNYIQWHIKPGLGQCQPIGLCNSLYIKSLLEKQMYVFQVLDSFFFPDNPYYNFFINTMSGNQLYKVRVIHNGLLRVTTKSSHQVYLNILDTTIISLVSGNYLINTNK